MAIEVSIKKMFKTVKGKLYVLIAFLLIAVQCFLSISSFKNESITTDEIHYLKSGLEVWSNPNWTNDPNTALTVFYHPPLTFYLHGFVSRFVRYTSDVQMLFNARLAMQVVLISFSLAILVIATKKYGRKSGLVALCLFVFNTEILTHGRLITVDLTLAFTIFLTAVTFVGFLEKKSVWNMVLAGIFLGLALLTKYISVLLMPLLLLGLFLYICVKRIKLFNLLLIKFAFLIMIALFVVNAGYKFKGSFELPQRFDSKLLNQLKNNSIGILLLKSFPKAYFVGAGYQFNISKTGWRSYLLGRSGYGGEKGFYLISFLLKTPIPFLLMIPIAIIFSKKRFLKPFLALL